MGPRSIKVPTFHGLQHVMDKFLMGACNHSTLFMWKIKFHSGFSSVQNTTASGGLAQIEGKSKNNMHTGASLSRDHNKTFDPPGWMEFVNNILVGHVWGLFQVRESPFPLNPTIILQGVPNDLTCFLNGPLLIIKHKIIPLALDNPWKTTPQEEPNATKPFKCLAQRLIKEALHHRKGFLWGEFPSYGKELPHDVGGISLPLLSEGTTVESQPTVGYNEGSYCQSPPQFSRATHWLPQPHGWPTRERQPLFVP